LNQRTQSATTRGSVSNTTVSIDGDCGVGVSSRRNGANGVQSDCSAGGNRATGESSAGANLGNGTRGANRRKSVDNIEITPSNRDRDASTSCNGANPSVGNGDGACSTCDSNA